MKEFKVGDRVRIKKPEIRTTQVSENRYVDWVQEMDYLDSTVQEITGIVFGCVPTILPKGNTWAIHPDWCELVSGERPGSDEPVWDGIIRKGDLVKCIKEVAMEPTGRIEFIKGKEYISEYDGQLTNESGYKKHGTSSIWAAEHFILVSRKVDKIPSGEIVIPEPSSTAPAKMKIYIAGKITGLEYGYVEARFDHAKQLIEKWGFEAVSPLDYEFDNCSWVSIMLILLPILDTCDGIYLLDNWDDSDGARIEKKFAEKKGMFVINNLKTEQHGK